MTLILQWTALAACLACTAWRLPSMLRKHNRILFWTFAMASISVALSIPALYVPIDGLLGGHNFANVFLRLSLFAVFFLLAAKVAAAYESPLAYKLIRGPAGLTVLALCVAGIWVTYFLSDLEGSSAGLLGFGDQASVAAYMWIGQIYMAYAAAVVTIPTARAAISRRPPLDRIAALLLCTGFSLVCITVPLRLIPVENGNLINIISFGSILFVAAGLAMIWVSFMRRPVSAKSGF